jgi:hypothetical protein
MAKNTIQPPTIHAQGLWDRLNEAVEADENLDVAGFFLGEIMKEASSELVFCCYCLKTEVKDSCCGTYDGCMAVDPSNLYAIAAYYQLDQDAIDNLEQAVGDHFGEEEGA